MDKHNCDNVNCNHNNTKGLCCLFNPDNCKYKQLREENAELKEKLNRYKHDCPNCSAFGKHCPHRVNGDPYTYDCYLTVAELEKENAELKETVIKMNNVITETFSNLTKAKEIIKGLLSFVDSLGNYSGGIFAKAEQFLNDLEK